MRGDPNKVFGGGPRPARIKFRRTKLTRGTPDPAAQSGCAHRHLILPARREGDPVPLAGEGSMAPACNRSRRTELERR
jgi:hypothetical protein